MKDQLQFCLSALSFSFFPFNLYIYFSDFILIFPHKNTEGRKRETNESWRTVTSTSLAEVQKKRL